MYGGYHYGWVVDGETLFARRFIDGGVLWDIALCDFSLLPVS